MKIRPRGPIAAMVIAGAIAIAAALSSWALASSGSSPRRVTPGSGVMTAAPATGSPRALSEAQFVAAMLVLHAQAIRISEIALERATRPEVEAIARLILSTQEAEASQMRSWNRVWFGVASAASYSERDPALKVPDEIAALESSSDFDRDFLTAMIPHHASAIGVANRLLLGSPRPELERLAQRVIVDQQQEMDQMQEWRDAWFP